MFHAPSGRKCVVTLAFVALALLAGVSAFAALTGSGVYAPPAIGSLAYNSFVPSLTPGAWYVDPVFGETVLRLTTDHVHDDIYARNMWWNADETRYLHRTTDGTAFADFWNVIDVATGKVTHAGIPIGGLAADGGFDPVDPNALYYLIGSTIHKVTLNSDGTWTDAVYWSTPGGLALKELGGTLNWFDASGRYMLVRYGPEPSLYLYDRQNLASGPYANPVDATNYIDAGSYIGVSPDGQFLVGYQSAPLPLGVNGSGQGVSWKLDHVNRAVALAPNVFWSLCGDHGAFLSASDGRNYMIANDCYSQAGLWRVDITNNAASLDEAQQQALPNNRLLLAYPTWSDFGHVSTTAVGDWAFLSTEDGTDTFNSGTAGTNGLITPWRAYRQEIIAINVITGEVRRLAHHRSRSVQSDYYSTPRVSAGWRGKIVGFASNFNQPGGGTPVVDVYAIPFAPADPPPSLTALAPNTTVAGAPGFLLTVSGTNFVSNSLVQWNGTSRTTTFVSGTQLQAAILAGDIGVAGTAPVTVMNPSPGGGVSNALTFTITPSFTVSVVKAGTGSGTVASTPAGVSCGASCSASFAGGTSVVLTPTPDSSSTFAGWSGCDAVAGTLCTVVGTATKMVTATFQAIVVPTPDTTPPTVSITAPVNGATVSNKVSVIASALDNVGVAGVQFTLDGANLGTAVTTAPYSVPWDTTTVANGTHSLGAAAWDAAGNTSTSAPVSVTVLNADTIPPTVSMTSPAAGTTVGGMVTAAARASDNVGVAGVQFKLDGANLGTAVTTAPYSVPWDTTTVANGTHSLSAAAWDAAGNTSTSAPVSVTVSNTTSSTTQSVTWVNAVNVTVIGNSIQKTSGCDGCYDAGATSQQQIASGSGYIEFTASETTALRVAGLTHAFAYSNSTINYGFRLQSGYAEVRENGTYRTDTPFKTGDVFRIAVQSGLVRYYKNGVLVYTSAVTPTYPLFLAAALANLNATITNAVIASVAPNGSSQLVWTNTVNVTATGNSLKKTSGCDGCYDAGATSQQQIASGDGYAEFTATETTALRVAGFTHAYTGTGPGTIDFGIRLQSGYAEVRENGTYRTDTPFKTGDVFRVAVQSGVVRYYKNGALFYTSAASPTYPLFLAAALANLNATITNAVIASGF